MDAIAGPRPPSSATSRASSPLSAATDAVAVRTRAAHSMASEKDEAPTGTTSRSCTSIPPEACAPPEMTLIIGSGSNGRCEPASIR